MKEKEYNVALLIGGLEGGGSANSITQILRNVGNEHIRLHIVSCGDGDFADQLKDISPVHSLGLGWPPAMSKVTRDGRTKSLFIGKILFSLWLVRSAARLAKYIRKNKIDLVHTNYMSFHTVAFLACLISRKPCVFHWRGIVRKRSEKMLCSIFHKLLGYKAYSIANSRATLQSIKHIGKDHVSVIYNSISDCDIVPNPKLRQLLGVDDKVKVIGMVGTMNPIKGHEVFLRAAGEITKCREDVHFVLVGGETAASQKDYVDRLLSLRSELGISDKITFLGHRSDAQDLMCEMDALAVCTLPPGEGFGLVIVEAMARGVPVISTNVGAAPEIIDEETGILIPPCDTSSLASAIVSILGDENKSKLFAMNALKRYKDNFSMKQMVDQVRSIYLKQIQEV